jgi:hypothetical protein
VEDSVDATSVPGNEVVGNFHTHTLYSDGTGTHTEVAAAAARTGLDVLAYTDHNVWTEHHSGWYTCPTTGRRVLRLMGEEVNNTSLPRSINHYLCLGAGQGLSAYAPQPQSLIDACRHLGGAGFIAHPIERPVPLLRDSAAHPWLDWSVAGYTGIEVWNYGSELKSRLNNLTRAVLAMVLPGLSMRGPFPETLALWDRLTADGRQVVGIGNSDAHADVIQVGPFRRRVFTYEDFFRAVNTYLLLDAPLAADGERAGRQVVRTLQAGHAFVAFGPPGAARGFRFLAIGQYARAGMGDEIRMEDGLILRAHVPRAAYIRLIQNGRSVAEARGYRLHYTAAGPGVYRVEVYRAEGLQRVRLARRPPAWILSNPVYVRA